MEEKISVEHISEMYYQDIYKFCCSKCRDAEVAQDITQETFLLLINKKDELANNNIRSWLLNVANNKIHEHFREKSKEISFVDIDDVEIPTFDSYDYESFNFEDVFDEVQRKILNMLNEKEKALFIKLYIEKKSVSLVAEELNITEENLRTRKSRLKKKVKGSIEHIYFFILVFSFKIFN